MVKGFVKLQRGIFDNDAFKQEPLTEREAYIWLLEHAAYRPENGLERGQVRRSTRELAADWRWTKSRVHNFLKRLAAKDMIVDESGTKMGQSRRTITICNYDGKQHASPPAGTKMGQESGQQTGQPIAPSPTNLISDNNYNKLINTTSRARARRPEIPVADLVKRLCNVTEIDINALASLWVTTDIRGWLQDGADVEFDIVPTVAAVTARRRQRNPYWQPKSWAYFSSAIADTMARRQDGPPKRRNGRPALDFERLREAVVNGTAY